MPLVGRFQKATRANRRAFRILHQPRIERVGGDLQNIFERDAIFCQLFWFDLHLWHVDLFAPDRHIGHTTARVTAVHESSSR